MLYMYTMGVGGFEVNFYLGTQIKTYGCSLLEIQDEPFVYIHCRGKEKFPSGKTDKAHILFPCFPCFKKTYFSFETNQKTV